MGGGRGGLPDTKRGDGQSTSGPIYEKWGGGGGVRSNPPNPPWLQAGMYAYKYDHVERVTFPLQQM